MESGRPNKWSSGAHGSPNCPMLSLYFVKTDAGPCRGGVLNRSGGSADQLQLAGESAQCHLAFPQSDVRHKSWGGPPSSAACPLAGLSEITWG